MQTLQKKLNFALLLIAPLLLMQGCATSSPGSAPEYSVVKKTIPALSAAARQSKDSQMFSTRASLNIESWRSKLTTPIARAGSANPSTTH